MAVRIAVKKGTVAEEPITFFRYVVGEDVELYAVPVGSGFTEFYSTVLSGTRIWIKAKDATVVNETVN